MKSVRLLFPSSSLSLNRLFIMGFMVACVIFLFLALFVFLKYKRDDKEGGSRKQQEKMVEHFTTLPSIYCIMSTGKSKQRIHFAKVAVTNFLRQTVQNKYLIIVNESRHHRVLNSDQHHPNIIELFNVNKFTLGGKKNFALELVPFGSIWTTWDDDDWRSDDYLAIMTEQLLQHPNKKFLMFVNRLEHNLNTDFTWRFSLLNGTYIFFCFKLPEPLLQFDDLNNKEDVAIKKYLLAHPDQVHLYDNERFDVYIRFSHLENTSSFVDKTKKHLYLNTPIVKDTPASENEKKYVSKIKNMYYTINSK
jgi:hypothetical protein